MCGYTLFVLNYLGTMHFTSLIAWPGFSTLPCFCHVQLLTFLFHAQLTVWFAFSTKTTTQENTDKAALCLWSPMEILLFGLSVALLLFCNSSTCPTPFLPPPHLSFLSLARPRAPHVAHILLTTWVSLNDPSNLGASSILDHVLSDMTGHILIPDW